jgi:four helix bundle protein
VRRSSYPSATVVAKLWKRTLAANFVNNLTDAEGENGETGAWLDFTLASGYLEIQLRPELGDSSEVVGAMLGTIIRHP